MASEISFNSGVLAGGELAASAPQVASIADIGTTGSSQSLGISAATLPDPVELRLLRTLASESQKWRIDSFSSKPAQSPARSPGVLDRPAAGPSKIANPRDVLKRELSGRLVYLSEDDFHRMRTDLGIRYTDYFQHQNVMHVNHRAVTENPLLERWIYYQLRLPRVEDLVADIEHGGLAKNMPGIIGSIYPPEQTYYTGIADFENEIATLDAFLSELTPGASAETAVERLRQIHIRFLAGYAPAIRLYTQDGKRYLTSTYLEDRSFEAIRDSQNGMTVTPLHSAALVLPATHWNSTLDQTRTNFLMALIDMAAQQFFHQGVVQVLDTFGQDPGKTARVNNVLLSIQFQSENPKEDLQRFVKRLPYLIRKIIDEFYHTVQSKDHEYDDLMDSIADIFDEYDLEIKPENIASVPNASQRGELARLYADATIVSAERDFADHFVRGHVTCQGRQASRKYSLLDEHGVPMSLDEARLDLISGAFVTADLAPFFAREDISPAEIQKMVWEMRSRVVSLAEYTATKGLGVIGESDVAVSDVPQKLLFPEGRKIPAAKMYAGLAQSFVHDSKDHYNPESKFTRLGWDCVDAMVGEMGHLYYGRNVIEDFLDLEAQIKTGHSYRDLSTASGAYRFLTFLDDYFSGLLSENSLVVFQGLGGFPSVRHFRHLAGSDSHSIAGRLSALRANVESKFSRKEEISQEDIDEMRKVAKLLPEALDFMREAGVEKNGITVPVGLHAEATLRAAQRQYRVIKDQTGQNPTDKKIISVGKEASGFQNFERARRTRHHARDSYADIFKTLSADVATYLGEQHGGAHVEVVIYAQGDEVVANFVGHDSRGQVLTYEEIATAYQIVLAQKLPGETARTEKHLVDGVQSRLDLYEIGLIDDGRIIHALRHPKEPDQFYVVEDLTRKNNDTGWVTITPDVVANWQFSVPEFGNLPGLEVVINDGTIIRHLLVAKHPSMADHYYVVKDFHAEFWGMEINHEWAIIESSQMTAASSKHFTLARKKLGLRLAMHTHNFPTMNLDDDLDPWYLSREIENLNAVRSELMGYDNVIKVKIKEAMRRGETPPLFFVYG